MTAALAIDSAPDVAVDYLTPAAEFLTVWVPAGVQPRDRLIETYRGIERVITRAPIQRAEVEWLLEYACRPSCPSARLRYMSYAALGAGDARVGFVPLTASERRSAIRSCADELEMLRLMGVKVGAP